MSDKPREEIKWMYVKCSSKAEKAKKIKYNKIIGGEKQRTNPMNRKVTKFNPALLVNHFKYEWSKNIM